MSETVSKGVAATRAQLEQTLNAIDDKFNVQKRAGEVAERVQKTTAETAGRVQNSYRSNPVPWIVGATAAAVVVAGLIVWAIVSDD